MSLSGLQLLEDVVETYDDRGEPVGIAAIEAEYDVDRAVIEQHLRTLEECALLERVGEDRYRPTVTAREFLALDVENDAILVVDAGRE